MEISNKENKSSYIKLSSKEKSTIFAEYGEKCRTGELRRSHYAVENDVGYFYYQVMINKSVTKEEKTKEGRCCEVG